jgi:predicted RNA-binding Zn-ribbon protein involved in translation (DUF1610 family)
MSMTETCTMCGEELDEEEQLLDTICKLCQASIISHEDLNG